MGDLIAPRWKVFNLLDNKSLRQIRQQTQKLQGTLKQAESLLKQADSLLDTVQSITSILRRIEQTVKGNFWSLLKDVIGTFRDLLDSIRSQGVYALDLVSYHFQDKYPDFYEDGSELLGEEWWQPFMKPNLVKRLSTNVTSGTTRSLLTLKNGLNMTITELGKSTLDDKAQQIATLKTYISQIDAEIKAPGGSNPKLNLQDIKKKIDDLNTNGVSKTFINAYMAVQNAFIGLSYKQETYYEFIDTICQAFMDENDRPGRPLMNFMVEESFKTKKGTVAWGVRPNFKFDSDMFQSGRPIFNNRGDYVKVFVIGFAFPSIDDVINIMNSFQKIISMVKDDGVGKFKQLKDTFSSPSTYFFAPSGQFSSPSFQAEMITRGEEPNFVGVTLNMLLKDIFAYVDQLLNYIEQLNFQFTTSVFDAVDNVAQTFQFYIRMVRDVLDLIMQIISLIESLLSLTRGYTLTIESRKGIPGVIEQLKKSQPFAKSQMTANKILQAFNLTLVPDARMFITAGATSKRDMIMNVAKYQLSVTQAHAESQDLYTSSNNEFNALQTKLLQLNTVITQCNAFNSALQASSYNQLIIDMNAQLAIYNAEITALNNSMNNELQIDSSRTWLDNQIASFAAELIDVPDANASPFNQANYEARKIVQDQITALDAQYADPNAPMIPDYTTQRANLVFQLDILTQSKSDHDNTYTDKKNRYIAIKGVIDAFCSAHPISTPSDLTAYTTKIGIVAGEISNLKAARGLVYDAYVINRNNNLNQQTSDQESIVTKQSQIVSKQSELAAKSAELAYRQAINPSDPQIPILQAAIAQLNIDITNLNSDIITLRNDITSLQAALIVLDNNMTAYDAQSVKDQEAKSIERNAYIHWKNAEDYRLQKIEIEAEKTYYYTTEKTIIDALVHQLVTANVPVLIEPSYSALISELETKEGFDPTFPDVTRVQNASAKITMPGGSLEMSTIKKDISKAQVDQYAAILVNIPTESMNKTMNQLLGEVDQEEQFNPNEKMYYGGFLVCFGHPSLQSFTNATTDIVSLANQKVDISNGEIKELKQSIQTIQNQTKQIFSKIFK